MQQKSTGTVHTRIKNRLNGTSSHLREKRVSATTKHYDWTAATSYKLQSTKQ